MIDWLRVTYAVLNVFALSKSLTPIRLTSASLTQSGYTMGAGNHEIGYHGNFRKSDGNAVDRIAIPGDHIVGEYDISLLDGDNKHLGLRMRQHGNFIETAPLGLILMGIAEMQGAARIWLHVIVIMLLVGRVMHPFGLDFDKATKAARIAGTMFTQILMLVAVYLVLWPVIAG